jgi:predicted nucleotidyltransferase
MNIHFTDEILYTDLCSQSVGSIKVGSHMYGLNNENSDTDWLTIYIQPIKNRNSFMWEHHQLQFKKDKIDYNFSDLQTFIRNTLTGDSTINFEVLWSDDLKNTEFAWLSEYKEYFINYNIIKSYLGLAKRDLKYWKKDTHNGKKHTIETHKKLSHFVRGVICAKMLINGYFKLDLKNHKTFEQWDYSDYELLYRIKHGAMDYSFKGLVDIVEKQMHFLRVENNVNLENKNIPLYMNSNMLRIIDNKVNDFIEDFDKQSDIIKTNYDTMYYKTLENGVQYE